MPKTQSQSDILGNFIRENVIPPGLSVTATAGMLGVSRPTLSRLLNGRSKLSPDMASKLELTFGVPSQELLDRQTEYDRCNWRETETGISARVYIPSFMEIRALEIEKWAKNIETRSLLAVLIRKLVSSTGSGLLHVDFPGYDNAERRGWDGQVETTTGTPWIPKGKSGWEFGTNIDYKKKANNDFHSRCRSVSPAERSETAFVFVTPWNWKDKNKWAQVRSNEGGWKAVRAFDASDLEQWLETSITARIWLAEQLGMPTTGFKTLERCWQEWQRASEPQISRSIFETSVISYRKTFQDWLEGTSPNPLKITAESKEEALAFLDCLFQDSAIEENAPRSKDRACVFTSTETLEKLALTNAQFIPIVHDADAERVLVTNERQWRYIVFNPRNAIRDPDIVLGPLSHDTFEKAVAKMGIEGNEAERLARETGRSPTILRRRLSRIDAIKEPPWSKNACLARSLIPLTLVGTWHTNANADCEFVSTLADRPYSEIEENITELMGLDDAPVWSVGGYQGVLSKIDALFAIRDGVTKTHLDNFFWLAEYLLSEDDSALELPEDHRWAAGIHGKLREHSFVLRQAICETLVILAVHGNNLFQERLGVDIEGSVSRLIRDLILPLTLDSLISLNQDLPRFAEMAPQTFLELIEDDLQKPQPVVVSLLNHADSLFTSPRTGLLWALECLAWQHLPRVNLILGRLARITIDDTIANTPSASLKSIFRPWWPQTAASLKDRIKALETLTEKFPDIGWIICVDQLRTGFDTASPSRRPLWRNDVSGAGQPVSENEKWRFKRKALDLAIKWPNHDSKTLGDLVDRLANMPGEIQVRIWDAVGSWADSQPVDWEVAELRSRVRWIAFNLIGRHSLTDEIRQRAREIYYKLQPHNPIVNHAWLFDQHWVASVDNELDDENSDYIRQTLKSRELRAQAMQEIWVEFGAEGVMELLTRCNAPDTVGIALAETLGSEETQFGFLEHCFSTTGSLARKVDGCLQGILTAVDREMFETILSSVADSMEPCQVVRLFQCCPFRQSTWRQLDLKDKTIQNSYWQTIDPPQHQGARHEAEASEIVDRLLEAERPIVAFNVVQYNWTQVETSRLKSLLISIATGNSETPARYRLDAYYISKALEDLSNRACITPDELAQFEFWFFSALESSDYGIPNLEKKISESPVFFVQLLSLVFKRNDDGCDPREWQVEDEQHRFKLAGLAQDVLHRMEHLPGTDQTGKINEEELLDWIIEVCQLCSKHGRIEVGERQIGQLLSKAPAEEDGNWPCLPVCAALTNFHSPRISEGFRVGVLNSRGAHYRGQGGEQERELAAKYRNWANMREYEFPGVGGTLQSIAEYYHRQAKREDNRSKVEERLGHWVA